MRWAKCGELRVSQGGEYVVVEKALVQLSGTRPKVAAMRHPLAGPLGQRDVAPARVHPRSP
jgi:hypothetical protein